MRKNGTGYSATYNLYEAGGEGDSSAGSPFNHWVNYIGSRCARYYGAGPYTSGSYWFMPYPPGLSELGDPEKYYGQAGMSCVHDELENGNGNTSQRISSSSVHNLNATRWVDTGYTFNDTDRQGTWNGYDEDPVANNTWYTTIETKTWRLWRNETPISRGWSGSRHATSGQTTTNNTTHANENIYSNYNQKILFVNNFFGVATSAANTVTSGFERAPIDEFKRRPLSSRNWSNGSHLRIDFQENSESDSIGTNFTNANGSTPLGRDIGYWYLYLTSTDAKPASVEGGTTSSDYNSSYDGGWNFGTYPNSRPGSISAISNNAIRAIGHYEMFGPYASEADARNYVDVTLNSDPNNAFWTTVGLFNDILSTTGDVIYSMGYQGIFSGLYVGQYTGIYSAIYSQGFTAGYTITYGSGGESPNPQASVSYTHLTLPTKA